MSKDRCPVLDRFIREYKGTQKMGQEFYYDVDATLEGYLEADQHSHSRKCQMLRAWYCVDIVWWRLLDKLSPSTPLKRTREGLTEMIETAEAIEKQSVVRGMEISFEISGNRAEADAPMKKDYAKKTADGSLFIIEVCKFFRPKLRNEGSLARMGYYAAKALRLRRHSSDVYLKHARDLANITEEHAITWTP